MLITKYKRFTKEIMVYTYIRFSKNILWHGKLLAYIFLEQQQQKKEVVK